MPEKEIENLYFYKKMISLVMIFLIINIKKLRIIKRVLGRVWFMALVLKTRTSKKS